MLVYAILNVFPQDGTLLARKVYICGSYRQQINIRVKNVETKSIHMGFTSRGSKYSTAVDRKPVKEKGNKLKSPIENPLTTHYPNPKSK